MACSTWNFEYIWGLEMRHDIVILYREDKLHKVVSFFSEHRDDLEVSRLVANAKSHPDQPFLPMLFQLEKTDISLGILGCNLRGANCPKY